MITLLMAANFQVVIRGQDETHSQIISAGRQFWFVDPPVMCAGLFCAKSSQRLRSSMTIASLHKNRDLTAINVTATSMAKGCNPMLPRRRAERTGLCSLTHYYAHLRCGRILNDLLWTNAQLPQADKAGLVSTDTTQDKFRDKC